MTYEAPPKPHEIHFRIVNDIICGAAHTPAHAHPKSLCCTLDFKKVQCQKCIKVVQELINHVILSRKLAERKTDSVRG